MTVRPAAGQQVTLLFEVAGRPVTRVTHVRQVFGTGVVLSRNGGDLDGQPAGSEVAVIFVQGDQLYRWPMRLQEVLPASYCLASVKEPGQGERREFVRAGTRLHLTLRRGAGEPPMVIESDADLSASGFRVEIDHELPVGCLLEVEIRRQAGGEPARARARVVRAAPGGSGRALACEFVLMGSADEARLVDLIFDVRADALQRRIEGS